MDFLKVDNQLISERIAHGQVPIMEVATGLHQNMRKALVEHFDHAVINSMDMTVDAAYNFGESAVARPVEDYFPEEEFYEVKK